MIPTLLGVVLLVFFLFKYFGGDPAEILGGLNASPEQIEANAQTYYQKAKNTRKTIEANKDRLIEI